MSETTTTRLLLTKPTPGSGEPVDVSDHLNGNWDKVDAAVGAFVCTSGTRPTGADRWAGRLIFETDTGKMYIWDATDTQWRQILVDTGAGALFDTYVYVTRGSAANTLVAGQVTGDSNGRYNVAADGFTSWGPGNAAFDTTLYRASANVLQTDDDFRVVGGTSVPRGIVKWGERTTASSTTTAADAGVLRVDNISYLSGRMYKIWTTPLHLDSSVANDEIRARLRQSTSGNASTGSGILSGTTVHARQVDAAVSESHSIQTTYTPATNETGSILLCVGRIAGSGNCRISNSDGDETIRLYIEDIGIAPSDSGVDI